MERAFKGIWIPAEIWLDESLSMTLKILFVEIDSLDTEKGCFASNAYFAKFIGVDKMYVSQLIAKLKDMDYIYEESFDGRKRILRSNMKIVYGARTIITETATPEPEPDNKADAELIAEPLLQLREVEGFLDAWIEFKAERKRIKPSMTPRAEKIILDDLLKWKNEGMNIIDSVKQATASRWRRPFPPIGRKQQTNFVTGETKLDGEYKVR